MISHPRSTSEEGLLLILLGGLLAIGPVSYHFIGPSEAPNLFVRGFELALIVLMAIGIMYGGYLLQRTPRISQQSYETTTWCLTIGIGVASFAGSIIILQYNVGATIVDSGYIVLLAGTSGAAGGTFIGINQTQLAAQRAQLYRHRTALTQLNRLLRHHILNALQVIHICVQQLARCVGSSEPTELEVIDQQCRRIETVASNIRTVCETINGDRSMHSMTIGDLLTTFEETIEDKYGPCSITGSYDETAIIHANEALLVGLELVIANWETIDSDTYHIDVTTQRTTDQLILRLQPENPSFTVPFTRSSDPDDHLGHGDLELSILDTLTTTYDGEFSIEDDPDTTLHLAFSRPNGFNSNDH